MIDINGYEISKAFTGGEPVNAIYSFGVKVWPVEPEPVDYSKQYFRLSPIDDLHTADIILRFGSLGTLNPITNGYDLYYKKGSQSTWTKLTSSETRLKIQAKDYIELKGVNNSLWKGSSNYFHINGNSGLKYIVSGNIMSLLYGDNFVDKYKLESASALSHLFYVDSLVLDASNLILPATTLSSWCYSSMFYYCTGLTTAPALPATTLAEGCYQDMFNRCTGLTSSPKLPATTLANNCYDGMFSLCTGLTTAPELPATTLANSCYYEMFYNCTSLTTAPELPATTLANSCYYEMFYNCSKINYIKANFTTTPSSTYTSDWLSGVSSTGTFVANPNATWTSSVTRGASTVPEGWIVEKPVVDWGGLTFTARSKGEIGMTHSGTNQTTTKPSLSYSKNGSPWVEWDYTPIAVTTGDKVYLKGVNDVIGGPTPSSESDTYSKFTLTAKIAASGNIMSLLYGEDYEGKVDLSGKNYCFRNLFYGCTALTTAPSLPATTLASHCYSGMFRDCTALTTAPSLPATVLASYCYNYLFYGCTALTTAPELPNTELATGCYAQLFHSCTALTTAPSLPATTLATYCYSGMFQGCTSLTTAPELPATKLATFCYGALFSGCSKLNYVKAKFKNKPSTTYTSGWLSGVAATGTFVANSEATWPSEIERGPITVPEGWNIVKQ